MVSDVGQTQQSAASHVGADVPTGRQMAPESPTCLSLLPCGMLGSHYPRQESRALAAHAGICAGGAGYPAFLPRPLTANRGFLARRVTC